MENLYTWRLESHNISPMDDSLTIGEHAEYSCCIYLQKQGLKLIEKNYRCKLGEIDLVMKDGKTVVFVEVRYRKNNNYGGALESVTAKKQAKLRSTALLYLQNKTKCGNARFDVVAMSEKPQNSKPDTSEFTYEWIKNAF